MSASLLYHTNVVISVTNYIANSLNNDYDSEVSREVGKKIPLFNDTGNSRLSIYYSHSLAFLEYKRGEILPRVQIIVHNPGYIIGMQHIWETITHVCSRRN